MNTFTFVLLCYFFTDLAFKKRVPIVYRLAPELLSILKDV